MNLVWIAKIVLQRSETTLGYLVAFEECVECLVTQRFWETGAKGLSGSKETKIMHRKRLIQFAAKINRRSLRIITQPQVASYNMLEQSYCLRLHKLSHHIAQYGDDGEESLVSVADIRQPRLVQ